MTATLTRLRPILIGLVAILLTAGIAFAGRASAPASGPAAGSHALQGPDRDEDQDEDGDASGPKADKDKDKDEAEDGDSATPGDNCAIDPTGLSDEDLAALRHGQIVCWAAHQPTPDGYRNHGAWVSEWAKKNKGHAEQGDAASPNGHGKPKNH